MQHSKLPASKTSMWANCSGSTVLSELFAKYQVQDNKLAQLGSCAHELLNTSLSTGLRPEEYLGQFIEIVDLSTENERYIFLPPRVKYFKNTERVLYEVDEDMVEAVTTLWEYVHNRLVELFPNKKYTSIEAIKSKALRIEYKVKPLSVDCSDTGGTADIIIDAWPIMFEIIDYKHGQYVEVDIKDNPQLKTYALGWARENNFDYDFIRYTISQPRYIYCHGDGISSEQCNITEIKTFQEWLQEAVNVIHKARLTIDTIQEPSLETILDILYKQEMLIAGQVQCKWCSFFSRCPAAQKVVEETLQMDFADSPEELASIAYDQLSRILHWIPYIKQFIKQVQDTAEQHLLDGGKIKGFNIINKRGRRVWRTDLEEIDIIEHITKNYGLTSASLVVEPSPSKLKSLTQVEKLIPRAQRKDFSESLLHYSDGAPAMVPNNSSSSSSTLPTVSSDFSED